MQSSLTLKAEKIEKCRGNTGGIITSPDTIQIELVELISWKKYFSKEKADVKFRKELRKNSERNARNEALKLEKLVSNNIPGARTGSAGPSAGGNPNAKRKSEQDKGASKAKEKVTQANSSRSLREYLVDSGAALHIISKHALTKRNCAQYANSEQR